MAFAVTIIVATFYRERLLRRTLLSCMASRDVDLTAIEIVTVDNSPDGTAREVVEKLRDEAGTDGPTLRYVHEPRPGISHARNAGVRAATTDLVAFIDDDEEADPYWLSRLLACQSRYRAEIVLGPVYPTFEVARAAQNPFWRQFFTTDSGQASGEIAKRGGGTHNCLIVKHACCVDEQPFHPALGLTGGEDSRFFQSVKSRGGRIIWCADAVITEFVPASRTRWSYALRRQIRENQLHLQFFLWSTPPQYFQVPLWMTIGLLQALLFLPLMMIVAAFDHPMAMKCAAKVAGGVGKLLWFPRLTLIGYGSSRRDHGDQGAALDRRPAVGRLF